jgi:hypothetical protein
LTILVGVHWEDSAALFEFLHELEATSIPDSGKTFLVEAGRLDVALLRLERSRSVEFFRNSSSLRYLEETLSIRAWIRWHNFNDNLLTKAFYCTGGLWLARLNLKFLHSTEVQGAVSRANSETWTRERRTHPQTGIESRGAISCREAGFVSTINNSSVLERGIYVRPSTTPGDYVHCVRKLRINSLTRIDFRGLADTIKSVRVDVHREESVVQRTLSGNNHKLTTPDTLTYTLLFR